MKIKNLVCECGSNDFEFRILNKASIANRVEFLECVNCGKQYNKENLKSKNMIIERFTEG